MDESRLDRFMHPEDEPAIGGEPPQIQTVDELLGALGVERASLAERKRRVALWLDVNEPTPTLRAGLDASGLIS